MSFTTGSKLRSLARGRLGKVVPGSRNSSCVGKRLAHRRNQEKSEKLVSMEAGASGREWERVSNPGAPGSQEEVLALC